MSPIDRVRKMSENITSNPWWAVIVSNIITAVIVSVGGQIFAGFQGDRTVLRTHTQAIEVLQRLYGDVQKSQETFVEEHKLITSRFNTYERMEWRLDNLESRQTFPTEPYTLEKIKELREHVLAVDARLQRMEQRLWHLLNDAPAQMFPGLRQAPPEPTTPTRQRVE